MGNVTINGDLTGTAVGGLVGGAANLTTAGAIPYVSSAGVLNQDATALFWDAANNRLGVGTNAPGTPLQVVGQITSGSFTANSSGSLVLTNTINTTATRIDSSSDAGRVRLFNSSNATTWLLNADGAASHYSGGNFLIGTTTDDSMNKLQVNGGFSVTSGSKFQPAGVGGLYFAYDANVSYITSVTASVSGRQLNIAGNPLVFASSQSGSEHSRFAATTDNLLIGTSTDSNFKLNVAASGSAGTARFYGGAGVSDNTKLQVRAGAGQTSALTEWINAGATSVLAYVDAGGNIFASQVLDNTNAARLTSSGAAIASNKIYGFSSTTSSGGAADASLSRASAGVLQVGDGAANANGTLLASGIGLGVSPLSLASYRVLDMDGASGSLISLRQSGTSYAYIYANSAALTIDSRQNTNLKILTGGAEQITVSNLGVTTLYNSTPTTGVTRAVIRAGAGQSTTNLQEWQNSSGTVQSAITGSGDIFGQAYLVGNNGRIDFSNGTAYVQAIRRRSDSIIAFDNSTAIGTTPGNARDIMVRGVYAAETTSDPSAGDLSIAGANAQDTFRLYMKNDKLVVAYQISGTVNYLTIPLDGATTTWTQSTTAP